ncbi:type III pantothenate kinase [Rapidithrix thailandica]|uniref:Type III pantothenate kinase n=1 Tax=Rapidithrix thailandica TaxID=413964 RepID=A0AAW9S4S1_9BACT
MNAAIDLGNTHCKIGIFDGDQLIDQLSTSHLKDVRKVLLQHDVQHVILSKVGHYTPNFLEELTSSFQLILLDHQTHLPIRIRYKTPSTLGADRIAAVVGAYRLYPGATNLVIDLGTCITYDVVDAEGTYQGGGISPGIHMRFQALHHFTAGLPSLSTPDPEAPFVGASTEECIQAGVLHGVWFEIEGFIEKYSQLFGGINVVLCGGDSIFFESKLKPHIFVNRNLTMWGLNRILLNNVCEE